ncbi:unnamed protein product [Vitrella brassicaformis CCMP3155]|uniref:Uncharacterized protein n=1 Tax=Vitrella brassicaformis (strain CCMP3155) TaxID=1169540 RepID=A0A0G4FZ70_VITBC|nr:unnamed protein product [Vitrella brassicaformis CCMP3155]|eukprot:CEM20384.1 unnamed protein product [Vitrella brassicaformis CCMP3155]
MSLPPSIAARARRSGIFRHRIHAPSLEGKHLVATHLERDEMPDRQLHRRLFGHTLGVNRRLEAMREFRDVREQPDDRDMFDWRIDVRPATHRADGYCSDARDGALWDEEVGSVSPSSGDEIQSQVDAASPCPSRLTRRQRQRLRDKRAKAARHMRKRHDLGVEEMARELGDTRELTSLTCHRTDHGELSTQFPVWAGETPTDGPWPCQTAQPRQRAKKIPFGYQPDYRRGKMDKGTITRVRGLTKKVMLSSLRIVNCDEPAEARKLKLSFWSLALWTYSFFISIIMRIAEGLGGDTKWQNTHQPKAGRDTGVARMPIDAGPE